MSKIKFIKALSDKEIADYKKSDSNRKLINILGHSDAIYGEYFLGDTVIQIENPIEYGLYEYTSDRGISYIIVVKVLDDNCAFVHEAYQRAATNKEGGVA